MTEPMVSHDLPIRVRYFETDQMGFVHHANYLVYFEMGRTELLRASGWNYRAIEEKGFYLVVAKVSVRYRKPARYDDELVLTTRVSRVTPVRVEHAYQLKRGHELVAEGESTLACVDKDGVLQPMPPEIAGDNSLQESRQ
jgi:acyl-CoA thioester hydrolase